MKKTHLVYAFVTVALFASIPVIRVVQAQFVAPSKSVTAGMSNSFRVSYWIDVLADPGREEFHAKALEELVLPARLAGRLDALEDLARANLESKDVDVQTQAHLALGDALLERGETEEAKNQYLRAVLLGAPRAARYYAQRLWDIGEREESIRQSLSAIEKDGLQVEDCVGEDSLLRRIGLMDALPEGLGAQSELAPAILDYCARLKNGDANNAELIGLSFDPAVRAALQMKSQFAAQRDPDAIAVWDELCEKSDDNESVLQVAALACAELQFHGLWESSLALAEKVLQDQEGGTVGDGRRDEFLYRKALALSRLNRAEESIAAAKQGMTAGYPETSFGQRSAVLYCQRALFESPHYGEAKELLTTVISLAASEEAYLDAQYALPICEFGLRNFAESARLVKENLTKLRNVQTRWKQQLYLERFEKSEDFVNKFQARLKGIEERHAAFAQRKANGEVGR